MDWLLPVEIYELAKKNGDTKFEKEIQKHLESIKQENPKLGHLIDAGIALINHSFSQIE